MIVNLDEHERGVLFRFGRFLRVARPGRVLVLPLVDKIHVVDLERTLPGWQEVASREVDAMVAFLILSFSKVPVGLRPGEVRQVMHQAMARSRQTPGRFGVEG
jgi:hypothetical protein